MAGETILIVDDNPDVCILLGERVLPSYGYRTLTATDGQEGLWQIRTQKPDLILLDLRLPDMTGLDLLHILSSEGYDTPVILITAYGSELIAAQALRLGVRDYIIKPFTLDEIVESVERALIEQRLRRERNALADHLHNCTSALRTLNDTRAEIANVDDPDMNLCRMVEVAVSTTRAQRAQLWVQNFPNETLYLRVAQDGAGQQSYLLHKYEQVHPRVELALSSGEVQQWLWENGGDEKQVVLALPLLRERQAMAVLVVYIPEQETGSDELLLLILQLVGKWIEMVLEQALLEQQRRTLQGQIEAVEKLSQDVLLILDAKDRIMAVTPSIQNMLGQHPDHVVGQDFGQWIRQIESSQSELVEWYLKQADSERADDRYTFFFQDAEGTPRRAEVRILQRRGGDALPHRYLLFHEVTAHYRLEQTVRSLRQMLNEAVRGSPFGLFLTDIDGSIQAVNGTLIDMLQLSPEELRGKLLWEALSTADGSELLPEELARAYREGNSYTEIRWPGMGPRMGAETWGINTWQLLGDQGLPHAIIVLLRPTQSLSGESNP